MKTYQNKIGLELEYLLLDKEGVVQIIPDYWDRDSFPLLGEIRGEPGEKVSETLGNFYKALYEIKEKCKKSDYQLVFEPYKIISPTLYQDALKKMNTKEIAEKIDSIFKVKNIYGTSLNDYSDNIVKNGKIVEVGISCGLHIHFSSLLIKEIKNVKDTYESITLPMVVGKSLNMKMKLWNKICSEVEITTKIQLSTLNKPTIRWIISELDKKLLKSLMSSIKITKYRHPGYYELKSYGFEYRSLPTSNDILMNLSNIVEIAFELLNEIEEK